MTAEQIKLVISISLPIVGTLVGIFKDEIVNFLFGSRKFKNLKGEWSCEWTENPGMIHKEVRQIKDDVTITKVFGKIVKGKGSTGELGEWTINGEISECALTISYRPKRDSLKHNLGVVILEVNYNDQKNLKGKWYQYNGKELVGGDTTWKKRS